MNKKIKLNFYQSELVRISDWIKFSDQKSGVILLLYTSVIAFLFSQKNLVLDNLSKFSNSLLFTYHILLFCLVISLLLGLTALIKSFFPKLKNQTSKNSLCYFGNIAQFSYKDFLKSYKKQTKSKFKQQLLEQIYTNSIIATQKMKYVQQSLKRFIILSIFTLILLFFNN